ncbi:hypothetical protein ACTXT7_006058 [Hymenolepis weldensis]
MIRTASETTHANEDATKIEGLLFFLPYSITTLLCYLAKLLYRRLLKRITSESIQQSRKILRLDFFVCGFLAQYILVDSLAVSTEFGILASEQRKQQSCPMWAKRWRPNAN